MNKRLVISSDSHVMEPPNLWVDRMDPKYGDRIPHLVKGDPFDHQGIFIPIQAERLAIKKLRDVLGSNVTEWADNGL